MQTPIDTGKIIAELRKKAKYTQQSLAEALGITDKAISKWERGISCPDISLLPKISVLLDADIESLLSGVADVYSHKWKGILYIPESSFPLDTLIYDKPLVYYLLSNFLLVGITDILIISSKKNIYSHKIKEKLDLLELNIHIYLNNEEDLIKSLKNNKDFITNSNIFLITDVWFLFGASLTRNFQRFMSLQDGSIQLYYNNTEKIPYIFISESIWNSFFYKSDCIEVESLLKDSIRKNIPRGTICLPIKNYNQLCDVSSFVKFYEKYHHQRVCDLIEIIRNRGISLD